MFRYAWLSIQRRALALCSKSALSQMKLTQALLLFGLLLAGIAFRLQTTDARSVWFDEAFSWRLSQFSFADVINCSSLDNHPPLYFLCLKVWSNIFGTTTQTLRMLSVCCGIGTIVAAYFLVISSQRANGSPNIDSAVFAAGMIAVSVFQIRWSWDIRMYSFGVFLAVLSSVAMFLTLQNGRIINWALFSIITLALAYTHYYAFFCILAQTLFVFGYLSYTSLRRTSSLNARRQFTWLVCHLLFVLIGLSFWLPTILRQRDQVQDAFWTSDVTTGALRRVAYDAIMSPENSQADDGMDLLIVAILAILTGLLVKPSSLRVYLLIATLTPVLCSIVVSYLDTKIFCLRYFVFAHAFFYIAVGVIIGDLNDTLVRRLLFLAVTVWLIWVHLEFVRDLDVPHCPGAIGANEYLEASRSVGETVVVCSPLLYFSMLHHSKNRKDWYVYKPPQPIPHFEGTALLDRSEMLSDGELDELPGSALWVVDMTGWGVREVPATPKWGLLSERRFREVLDIQGDIIVRKYRIR